MLKPTAALWTGQVNGGQRRNRRVVVRVVLRVVVGAAVVQLTAANKDKK